VDVRDAGIERVESEQFRGTIRDLLFSSLVCVVFLILLVLPSRERRRRPPGCASSRGISLFKEGEGAFLGRKSFFSLSLS
jgi:hypothetical protein